MGLTLAERAAQGLCLGRHLPVITQMMNEKNTKTKNNAAIPCTMSDAVLNSAEGSMIKA
jgi:hypothetical protein